MMILSFKSKQNDLASRVVTSKDQKESYSTSENIKTAKRVCQRTMI